MNIFDDGGTKKWSVFGGLNHQEGGKPGQEAPERQKRLKTGNFCPVEEFFLNLRIINLIDLTDSHGGGDIDFGQEISDDIEPHKMKSHRFQGRFYRFDDLQITMRQGTAKKFPASVEIGAKFPFFWPSHKKSQHASVQQENSFVPIMDFGKIFLNKNLGLEIVRGGLEKFFCFEGVFCDQDNPPPPAGVERLDDAFFMFLQKCLQNFR